MKFLLALTFLLAFLALALTEPDTDRDLELLRDQLGVREKRESALRDMKKKKNPADNLRKIRKRKRNKKKNKRKRKNKNKMKRRQRFKKNQGRNTTTCSDSTKVSSDCLEVGFNHQFKYLICITLEISDYLIRTPCMS